MKKVKWDKKKWSGNEKKRVGMKKSKRNEGEIKKQYKKMEKGRKMR